MGEPTGRERVGRVPTELCPQLRKESGAEISPSAPGASVLLFRLVSHFHQCFQTTVRFHELRITGRGTVNRGQAGQGGASPVMNG